jgi:hypothetical protein
VLEKEKITVDKFLFYKLFKTLIMGQAPTGQTAIVKIGSMLGAKTFEEQKAEWKKCQAYLGSAK